MLQQNQKLQSIGTLAAGIAHDFNNLLAIILAQSETLNVHDKKEQEALDSIVHATQKAGKMTQQLLAFARKAPHVKKTVDINSIVKQTISMLEPSIPNTITLKTHLAENLSHIQVDDNQIIQVLLNLCFNAKAAMPNGGELIITTSNTNITENDITVLTNLKAGKYVKIDISDTGCGITKENLPRIFEPFFTTKNIDVGTGLGLASAYGIMQQHQGAIVVSSTSPSGTTFTLYLPT